MVLETTLTLDQYLALPEEKPYREWFNGRVVEKSMPNTPHARLQSFLAFLLVGYLESSGEGFAATELRHIDREQAWVYLPDVCVCLFRTRPEAPGSDPVEIRPEDRKSVV